MDILRRIQYNSPVVLTFALLSLAATVAGLLTGQDILSQLENVMENGTKLPG
jgi:hypothetical protein